MFVPDVSALALLPRPAYKRMVITGEPEIFGRIVAVSDDCRTAYVVWRATPGTLRFEPDPTTTDTCVVVRGSATVRQSSSPPVTLGPGALYQFPREPFELEIHEEFLKVSFLFNPEKLACQAEPL